MSSKKSVWDVIWQIVKFILMLGLSHISNRDKRRNDELSADSSRQDSK